MTGRVLVVDDVEQNVRLLEAKLSSEYYTVFSATSGIECLEMVKGVKPDIILLDVMMPEMDGFETCQRLKQDSETAHIPVIMVTALSEVEDRVEGLTAGAADFITKPIDELHLFARVKSLIRLKVMLDELRMRDKTGNEFGLYTTPAPSYDAPLSGHILIIDDDIIQQHKISDSLNDVGHQTTYLPPEEAIEHVAQHPYDMIVISTMLDDVDGLRLAMDVRSQEQNRQTPIMIIIDEHDQPLLLKALEIGVDDYIIAPIEMSEMIARTRVQLIRKHYQDLLKSSYEQNLSAAVIDSLTKLYNRRYLDAHLHNIVEESQASRSPLSLMTIDIDHFKAVNDHPGWGHDVGDEVLIEVARRIMESVRTTDLATRPGGEEFVIVMPNTSVSDAKHIAERTRQRMQDVPFIISADPFSTRITVSIGVSSLAPGEDAIALMKNSDRALYEAKDTGRNKVVIAEAEMNW